MVKSVYAKAIKSLYLTFSRQFEELREALSPERVQRVLRELLRSAAASGRTRRLKALLVVFSWSDADVAQALHAASSRRVVGIIASACPRVFQASAPLAVMSAVGSSNAAILQVLLEFGASPEKRWGEKWETPLHVAATRNSVACAVELLRHGVNPDAQDVDGDTPLHRAAMHGSATVLWLLLHKGGASVCARSGCRKHTPLHRAAAYARSRCVEVLLCAGADVQAKDVAGVTPLHTAAGVGASSSTPVVQMLLQHEADVNATDNEGFAAVHYAATGGNSSNIRLLADCGADVNARGGPKHSTALHIAAMRHSVKCVEQLVLVGAELNAPNRYGITPLHVATSFSSEDIVRELQRLGASADVEALTSRRNEACGRALIVAEADVAAGSPIGYLYLESPLDSDDED